MTIKISTLGSSVGFLRLHTKQTIPAMKEDETSDDKGEGEARDDEDGANAHNDKAVKLVSI